MRKKKNRGIEANKRRYGTFFVLPWVIGVVLFVIVPIFKTLLFSVSIVTIGEAGLRVQFTGFSNYYRLLMENTVVCGPAGGFSNQYFHLFAYHYQSFVDSGNHFKPEFQGQDVHARHLFSAGHHLLGRSYGIFSKAGGTTTAGSITSALGSAAGTTAYVDAIDFSAILSRLNLPTGY